MSRNPIAAAALLLGLAASPAFAQSQAVSVPATTAGPARTLDRTLEQNQRAWVAPRTAAPQAAPKEKPVATLPQVTGRRMELADKAR